MIPQPETAQVAALEEYRASLIAQYGPLIGGRDLVRSLGFRTQAAFDKARREQRLPIRVFRIEGRRGRFALTLDVAQWLVARTDNQSTDPCDPSLTCQLGRPLPGTGT